MFSSSHALAWIIADEIYSFSLRELEYTAIKTSFGIAD